MIRKRLICAISALAWGQAYAIDLDSPAPTPVFYAAETVASAGGASTNVSETVVGTVEFGITQFSSRFLRYDLPGTEFLALPSLAISGQGGTNIVYVSGGLGKDHVIYEVIADTGTSISPSDTATLTFGAPPPNLLLEGGNVEVTLANYDSAPGALNQSEDDLLASKSGILFAFTPGTDVASTSATTGTPPLRIDFAASDTRFEGGKTRTPIGAFYATEVPGDQFLLDGVTDITIAASRTAASLLRVSGDFTATVNDLTGNYVPERVFLSNDACASSILDADSVTADEAILVLGNTAYGTINSNASLSSGPDICMEVNGVSVIPEGNYTAEYEPVAASGFGLSNEVIELGSLRKNSATVTRHLILTPTELGGPFTGFIRVSNTSDTGGDVYFRLINDLGEFGPTVMLAEVIGSSSSRLEAGGSTRDITAGEIYAASIAADPSWSIGSEPLSRLRLVSTGDFGSIAVTLTTISLDETLITTY